MPNVERHIPRIEGSLNAELADPCRGVVKGSGTSFLRVSRSDLVTELLSTSRGRPAASRDPAWRSLGVF